MNIRKYFQKKTKEVTRLNKRFFDGIYFRTGKQKKNKKSSLLWILIVPIIISLFFAGRISAFYVLENINVVNLFRYGKYLIILQNNSELRSSGGFIGSYAVLETENFKIKNLSFNTNIYSQDRAYAAENYVEPPQALKEMLKGETWALRDANYNASFEDAASDIKWFYEQETGDKIDGVVGINAKIIVDLLKVTGPIKLDKYNITISSYNFYAETQYQIEKAYYESPENWVINEPKTILKDLYPLLLTKAMENKLAVYNLLKNELTSKEIVLNFIDPEKQKVAEKQNWAGTIPNADEIRDIFGSDKDSDYLYINSNSYSGNKSSLAIGENINYKLVESSDYGDKMLKANLKISRVHGGSYTWPDGKNTEWLRLFVPNSAVFLNATLNNKDISSKLVSGQELDKAYFGLTVVTEPGQANILEINYLLPFTKDYNLLVQKQPGRTDTLNINYNGNLLYDGILNKDISLPNI